MCPSPLNSSFLRMNALGSSTNKILTEGLTPDYTLLTLHLHHVNIKEQTSGPGLTCYLSLILLTALSQKNKIQKK